MLMFLLFVCVFFLRVACERLYLVLRLGTFKFSLIFMYTNVAHTYGIELTPLAISEVIAVLATRRKS